MTQPAWIKMRVDLYSDLRVARLSSRWQRDICHTSVRICVTIGMLHRTWSLFDGQTTDGTLPGVDLEWLDDQLGDQGWGQALVDVGWLVVNPDGLEVPDFTTHNGDSAKKRATAARRKQKSRSTCDKSHVTRVDKSVTPSSSSSSSSSGTSEEGGVGDDPFRGAGEKLRQGAAQSAIELEMPGWLPPLLVELDEHLTEARGSQITKRAWAGLIVKAARDETKFRADLELTFERSAKNLQDSSKTDDGPRGGTAKVADGPQSWLSWPDGMPPFMQASGQEYIEALWADARTLHGSFPEIPRATLQTAWLERARTLDSEPGTPAYFSRMIDEHARAEMQAWLHRAGQAVTTPAKMNAILAGGIRRAG